jgi:DNA-binding NarL/FixJ family response regulator
MRYISALIVTGSSSLQDGLLALATAIPQIKVIGEASDAALAIRTVSERCPALVLLDTHLSDGEAWRVLKHIKSGCPQTRCVVLADDVEQRREAEALGADVVLVKGTPPERLIAAIERLLPQRKRVRRKECFTHTI